MSSPRSFPRSETSSFTGRSSSEVPEGIATALCSRILHRAFPALVALVVVVFFGALQESRAEHPREECTAEEPGRAFACKSIEVVLQLSRTFVLQVFRCVFGFLHVLLDTF